MPRQSVSHSDRALASTSVSPIRRYHHKSRTGCMPCKKRRIKVCEPDYLPFFGNAELQLVLADGTAQCDEAKPRCANCCKKSLACSLISLAPVLSKPNIDMPSPVRDPMPPISLSLPRSLSQSSQFPYCRDDTSDPRTFTSLLF
jgi:hypothetical protein